MFNELNELRVTDFYENSDFLLCYTIVQIFSD